MSETILIVEDELVLRETLSYNLLKQGYTVHAAADGRQALELARSVQPDLLILDVMLPGLDGFEICRILRQETNLPILMLTARADEIDKVVGLEVGADDYLTKPFSMRELLARIKAHLRRERLRYAELSAEPPPGAAPAVAPASAPAVAHVLRFANLTLDVERGEVCLDETPLALKPKEYELLLFLARHRGRVFSREQILQQVWDWDFSGGSRTVDVHVRWLREKIEPDPANPTRLVTVRGMGYRFEG